VVVVVKEDRCGRLRVWVCRVVVQSAKSQDE
jgi:hypothetical protein